MIVGAGRRYRYAPGLGPGGMRELTGAAEPVNSHLTANFPEETSDTR